MAPVNVGKKVKLHKLTPASREAPMTWIVVIHIMEDIP